MIAIAVWAKSAGEVSWLFSNGRAICALAIEFHVQRLDLDPIVVSLRA